MPWVLEQVRDRLGAVGPGPASTEPGGTTVKLKERPCPLCQAAILEPHCPATTSASNGRHPTCTWHRCRRCNVTLDLVKRLFVDRSNNLRRIPAV